MVLPKHGQNIVRISGTVTIVLESGAILSVTDPSLEIARGNVPGHFVDNQHGRASKVDNGIETDVWDRANATDNQAIYIAPTEARIHQIVSSSASDDGSPLGVGARTISVIGLTSWDTREIAEVITLNGVTNVPTVNAYVIINHMEVLTKGVTSINVGIITATADVDGTISAQINAEQGEAQMAILGVPSIQDAFITNYYGVAIKNAAAVNVKVELLGNPNPNEELLNFVIHHTIDTESDGSSNVQHIFNPYRKFEGPTFLKVRANASANNTDVSAGFDAILVDN